MYVECLIFDDCSLINMAKLEYLCCVFQFSAIHQHKGTIWNYQRGGVFWGDMLQLSDGVRIECQPPCDQEKSVVPLWVSWLECNHWEPLLFARCTAASQVLRQFGKSLQMTAVTFINACCNQSVCTSQSNLSAMGLFQTEDLTQFVVYWFCCKMVAKYLCNFAVKLLSWNNYHTVYGGIFPFLFRSTRFWLISECKPLKVWGCLPAVHL